MAQQAKKAPRKRTPLLLAERFGAAIPAMARRLALMLLAALILGMLLAGLAAIDIAWLRVLLSAAILLAILMLFFTEGVGQGAKDAQESRRARRALKAGQPLSPQDRAACFHPLKPILAALIVFALPLVLAAFVSLTAKPYQHTLQDLPTWLTQLYASREDITAPLAAYQEAAAPEARTWIRMVVRIVEMPFVGFFMDPERQAEWLDRLSFLFVLLYPIAYIAGYFVGPGRQRKLEEQERKAKRVAKRRQERSTLAEQLTRSGGEVHYGQRGDTPEKEKKKLV